MTRDEIMAMKPGPDLDALVAAKVMGWKPGWSRAVAGMRADLWLSPGVTPHRPVQGFRPSTDIAAAREAESSLEGRGDTVISRYIEALMTLTACRKEHGLRWLWALIHGSPEHRCKAALIAVLGNNTSPAEPSAPCSSGRA